jgi:hypothetical protein
VILASELTINSPISRIAPFFPMASPGRRIAPQNAQKRAISQLFGADSLSMQQISSISHRWETD